MKAESVTVSETDDKVTVNAICHDSKGRMFGKSRTYVIINRNTVAMPGLRAEPQWAKDAIIDNTQYRSFYNSKA